MIPEFFWFKSNVPFPGSSRDQKPDRGNSLRHQTPTYCLHSYPPPPPHGVCIDRCISVAKRTQKRRSTNTIKLYGPTHGRPQVKLYSRSPQFLCQFHSLRRFLCDNYLLFIFLSDDFKIMNSLIGYSRQTVLYCIPKSCWLVVVVLLMECMEMLYQVLSSHLGAIVQKPIKINPRLNTNPGLNFALQKSLNFVTLC